MFSPPDFSFIVKDMPTDPEERHEILVDVFGAYLMWARKCTLDVMHQRVESEEERQRLGRLSRTCYEEAAKLSLEDRERAYQLAEATLANFARIVLTMISGQGFDDKLGPDRVFRYKLVMEICSATSGDVVSEEVINRKGKKFFPEYWGRWLNRFKPKSADEEQPSQT